MTGEDRHRREGDRRGQRQEGRGQERTDTGGKVTGEDRHRREGDRRGQTQEGR